MSRSWSDIGNKHPVKAGIFGAMAGMGSGLSLFLLLALLAKGKDSDSVGTLVFILFVFIILAIVGIRGLYVLKCGPEKVGWSSYNSMWKQTEYVLMSNVISEYTPKLIDPSEKEDFTNNARRFGNAFGMYCSKMMGSLLHVKAPSSSSIVYSAAIGNAIGGPALGVAAGLSAASNFQSQQKVYEETEKKIKEQEITINNYNRVLSETYSKLLSIIRKHENLREDWDDRWEKEKEIFDKEYRA